MFCMLGALRWLSYSVAGRGVVKFRHHSAGDYTCVMGHLQCGALKESNAQSRTLMMRDQQQG